MNSTLRLLFLSFLLLTTHTSAYLPGEDRFPSLAHDGGLGGNPASLSAFYSPGWMFAYRENPEDNGILRLGIHGENWGGAFRWIQGPNAYDWSEWSLTSSAPNQDRSFFVGQRLSLIRTSETDENAFAWSPGLLWRPGSWFALGYSSTALMQWGPRMERRQTIGASLHPTQSLTLSWNAGVTNKEQLKHFSSQVNQALLAEFAFLGFDVGFTIPLVDADGLNPYRLQLALPLGPYHQISIDGSDQGDKKAIRGFSMGGHTARASRLWKPQRLIRVPLGGRIAEVEPGFSLFGSDAIGLGTIRNHFAHLQADPGANPILFDFSGYSAGPAASLEIRRGIQALRASGKKTIAYIDDMRPSVMMAASAAQRVVLQPSSRVAFRGISSEILYYKGLLDWAGIKAEMLRHGRYKSAIEPYTADSMSAEARADLSTLLNGWWGIFRDSIATSRKVTATSLDEFATNPLITASAAHKAGLADTILYLDQIPAYAAQYFFKTKADPVMATWTPTSENLFQDDWSPRPKIAILNIEGTIVDGRGGIDRLSGASAAGADDLMELIDGIRKEGGYSALILRINSPGGSALASDELWHRLRSLANDGMPIIASIGDMAASGGYYLACAADDIIAEPTSIVGSIGIFGGKVDLSGLLAKLKLRSETVATHPSANAESMSRSFTENEKIALQGYMDEFYGRFVNIVAEARNKDSLSVDSLGEGRVFTAVDGVRNGLVDELGGLSRAIAVAKSRAGISESSPVEVIPLLGDGSLAFRNLSDQVKLLPWRSALEGTRVWAIWTPPTQWIQ